MPEHDTADAADQDKRDAAAFAAAAAASPLRRVLHPLALVNPCAAVVAPPRRALCGALTSLRWLPWRRFLIDPPASAASLLAPIDSHRGHHHHHHHGHDDGDEDEDEDDAHVHGDACADANHGCASEKKPKVAKHDANRLPRDLSGGCAHQAMLSAAELRALHFSLDAATSTTDVYDAATSEAVSSSAASSATAGCHSAAASSPGVFHVLPFERVRPNLLSEPVLTLLALQGFHLTAQHTAHLLPLPRARVAAAHRLVHSDGARELFEQLAALMPPHSQVDWLHGVVDYMWHSS